jgi:ketosteroid isomerase-like protein
MKALRLSVIAVFATGCLMAQTPRAADTDPHEADRKQLLALFAEVEAAINDQNVDRMLTQMDDNVTVVWLNAEVSRGKQEVKAYYGRMVGTEQAILRKYLTKAKVGAPAKFYGDVAVADGSAADEFYPNARGVFRLDSRWSATLARNSGGWKIVSLHLSSNVFNNPLLDEVKADIYYAGAGGVLAGLILMYVFMRLRRR